MHQVFNNEITLEQKNEVKSKFVLFYGNRSATQSIFKSHLDEMQGDKLKVEYIYSRAGGVDELHSGRVDKEKANLLLRQNIDLLRAEGFYVCGPEEMIINVSKCLEEFDVNKDKVHFELFTTPVLLSEKAKNSEKHEEFIGQAKIKVICDEEEVEFDLGADDEVILDAAIDHDLDLPFSCKGGVCCTCKAMIKEGKVTMDANYALSDAEVEEGYVLTCQAHPASSYVVIDYD